MPINFRKASGSQQSLTEDVNREARSRRRRFHAEEQEWQGIAYACLMVVALLLLALCLLVQAVQPVSEDSPASSPRGSVLRSGIDHRAASQDRDFDPVLLPTPAAQLPASGSGSPIPQAPESEGDEPVSQAQDPWQSPQDQWEANKLKGKAEHNIRHASPAHHGGVRQPGLLPASGELTMPDWVAANSEGAHTVFPPQIVDQLKEAGQEFFPNASSMEEVFSGAAVAQLPKPQGWHLQTLAWSSQRRAAQEAASRAMVVPSAPRIMRSAWSAEAEMFTFANAALRPPLRQLVETETLDVVELKAACLAHPTCQGVSPGRGLFTGVSAQVAPSSNSRAPATKQTLDLLTLAPVSAEQRLISANVDPSSPLHGFAKFGSSSLAQDCPRLPRTSVARGRMPLEGMAEACLHNPDCIAFSTEALFGLCSSSTHIRDRLMEGGLQGASETTRSIAQTLAALEGIDYRASSELFLKLPNATAALSLLETALMDFAPDARAIFSDLAKAAKRTPGPHATSTDAWTDTTFFALPPDRHCGSTASTTVEGFKKACDRRGKLLELSAALAHPVLQAVRDLSAVSMMHGMQVAYVTSTVLSAAAETNACLDSSLHVYVGDVSHLNNGQDTIPVNRAVHFLGMLFDEEWAMAHATLAWRPLGCLTFLPAWGLPRLHESHPPPFGWGAPYLSPGQLEARAKDKKLAAKTPKRGLVQQDLDIASIAMVAAASSPKAGLLMWEDDCVVCPGTLRHLSTAEAALEASGRMAGALKVGNGGSGIQYSPRLTWPLIAYLVSHRGALNVDVLMWRALMVAEEEDYLSVYTFSAHRGRRSSLKQTYGNVASWGRVKCGNELDFYWGEYAECSPPGLAGSWRCGDFTPEGKQAAALREQG